MKVYSKSDKEIDKGTYITRIDSNIPKESCQLTFADGSKLNNIALTKENTEKIEEILQEQKKLGIKNLPKLVRKQKTGYIGRIMTDIALCTGAGIGAYQITNDPAVAITTLGIICVGGLLLAINYNNKQKEVIREVKTLQYREKHEEDVKKFIESSPNAYLAFDGDEDEQYRRISEIYEMMNMGINPNSLFARECGTGLTDQEFKSLAQSDAKEKKLGLTYKAGYSYKPRNIEK